MNVASQITTVLVLWLITGLAFSSVYLKKRSAGHSALTAFKTFEGLFFVLSLIAPILYLITKL